MRALNEFEKSLLANHPHFYAALEMAAREKARYLKGQQAVPGYSGPQLTAAKVIAEKILISAPDSPCRDPKEFAKMFLQFHTANDVEVGEGNQNMSITNVVVNTFVGEGADFESFLDEVFRLLAG